MVRNVLICLFIYIIGMLCNVWILRSLDVYIHRLSAAEIKEEYENYFKFSIVWPLVLPIVLIYFMVNRWEVMTGRQLKDDYMVASIISVVFFLTVIVIVLLIYLLL